MLRPKKRTEKGPETKREERASERDSETRRVGVRECTYNTRQNKNDNCDAVERGKPHVESKYTESVSHWIVRTSKARSVHVCIVYVCVCVCVPRQEYFRGFRGRRTALVHHCPSLASCRFSSSLSLAVSLSLPRPLLYASPPRAHGFARERSDAISTKSFLAAAVVNARHRVSDLDSPYDYSSLAPSPSLSLTLLLAPALSRCIFHSTGRFDFRARPPSRLSQNHPKSTAGVYSSSALCSRPSFP